MDYREKNEGFITASKMKLFLDSPALYKAVYIDKVDTSNLKNIDALSNGTIVDKYLLTPDEFYNEYVFPIEWGLKADLIEHCENNGIKLTGKEKVEDLKQLIYWDKKVLTAAQVAIIEWVEWEVSRQPLFDRQWGYESQKEFRMEMNWLKLRGTLDRFKYDKDNNKIIIRDLKTTSSMYYNTRRENTQFFVELSTTDPWRYKLQLAMYVGLVHNAYPDIPLDNYEVIIDAIGTNDPYFYQGIKLKVNELEDIWLYDIPKILDDMILLHNNKEFNTPTKNRNKLAQNRYYKLWTEDCIQKDFDCVVNNIREDEEEFNRDLL